MDAIARYGLLAHYGPLAGRLLLAAIFIVSGISKALDPVASIGYARAAGLPFPEMGVWAASIIEIVCGVLILLGLRTREASLALFLYLIPVTAFFHWPVDASQFIQMMKNLAIMGGLITLAAYGPGPVSTDARRSKTIRVTWQPRVGERIRR